MFDVARRSYRLVAIDGRLRWAAVIVVAILVSGVEAVSALLIFLLLGMITGQGDGIELPVLGDVRSLAPAWDDSTLLIATTAFIVAFFAVRGALLVLKAYVEHRVTEHAGAQLSSRLMKGYLGLPYAWHLQRNSSQLIRNAHESVQTIVQGALRPLVKVISEGVLALGLLAVLLATSPVATLLAFVVLLPAIVGLLRIIQPRTKRMGRTYQAMVKATLQSLQQGLHGLRDIKVLGRERFFHRQFTADRRRQAHARVLHHTLNALPRALTETILVLFIGGFFALTVLLEGTASAAIPVLGVFAYAAFRLKQPINDITSAVNKLRFAAPALEDVEQDLDQAGEAAKITAREGSAPAPLPFEQAITLDQVEYRYPGADQPALHDISVAIRRGESIGLVGPTGGGKSTFVDVLVGLLEPTAGTVQVDGIDIRDRTRAWQQNIGIVPQTIFLVDDTVRGNIALGVDAADVDEQALHRAVRMAQLDEVIAQLPQGLDTVVGERGVRLSGGQRQRVAIARALYHDPRVLVFDEGTSALDNETEAALLETLQSLQGSRTLVTIAHRLTTVRHCDRIFVIEAGTISAWGTFEELHTSHVLFQGVLPGVRPT